MAFSSWQKLRASDLNTTTVSDVDSSVTDGTTTSTSFVNTLTTTGIRGIAFTAPRSGKVSVSAQALGRNATVAQYALMDFEVRTGNVPGSGTLVRAADENTASATYSDAAASQHALVVIPTLVSGLTPGDSYNASICYRATGGTAAYNRRKIIVQPSIS